MSNTKAAFLIEEGTVAREMNVGGRKNRSEKELLPFLLGLGARAPVDLGWIPPGLRSYTQAGDHAQLVLECPPAVNHINWGESEGGSYEVYVLAQPWRIIIGDLYRGNLLGARMFYSPIPFSSPEQPVYHANIPNLNCKGYRGVGVGWICLYHNESWEGWSLGRKAIRLAERCSGVEAYNNANMRETDGPRFYEEQGRPQETWDPHAWEKRTEDEGVDWTLDPDLWIPVKVRDRNQQDRHYHSGEVLTLDMAMTGQYQAYYNDSYEKPALDLRRGKHPENLFTQCVVETFNRPPKTHIRPPKPKVKLSSCARCKNKVPSTRTSVDGEICQDCAEELQVCVSCERYTEVFNSLNGDVYCPECTTFCLCANCGEGIEEGACSETKEGCYCNLCAVGMGIGGTCDMCGDSALKGQDVTTPNEVLRLCPHCLENHLLCGSCERLSAADKVITTKSMVFACEDCWVKCSVCAFPVLKEETNEDQQCEECQ